MTQTGWLGLSCYVLFPEIHFIISSFGCFWGIYMDSCRHIFFLIKEVVKYRLFILLHCSPLPPTHLDSWHVDNTTIHKMQVCVFTAINPYSGSHIPYSLLQDTLIYSESTRGRPGTIPGRTIASNALRHKTGEGGTELQTSKILSQTQSNVKNYLRVSRAFYLLGQTQLQGGKDLMWHQEAHW